MAVTDSVIASASTTVVRLLGYTAMKPKQLRVVAGILGRRDVFAVLPTGFGKTLCFACLPLVFDQLLPLDEPSVVLVITTAIMKDQASALCTITLMTCRLLET